MTTRTSKEQAEGLMNQISVLYGEKPWLKKMKLTTDDHGYAIEIYLNRELMAADGCTLPHQTNVKILVINRN